MEIYYYLNFFLFHLISYIVLFCITNVYIQLWWKPKRIENHFLKQGIKGPKYRLLWGNLKELASLNLNASAQNLPLSHHILPRVLSFYHNWSKIYGPTFLVWFGKTPRLIISDPAHIKEILVLKSECFEKVEQPLQVKRIEGHGLLNLKGDKWAQHRKIIQPIFNTDNLKRMLPMMAKLMEEALVKWFGEISKNGKVEIEVADWFKNLSEDVITRVTFGSSYEAGRAIFELQAKQIAHAAEAYHKLGIPGYRFLPTKNNITSRRLEKKFRESLLNFINNRRTRMKENPPMTFSNVSNDLLELMIKAADGLPPSKQWLNVTENEIVEECKTFLFAGKETTSNLLTWTTVLLAMHPEWQEQARMELLRVCGAHCTPTKDELANLKMLGMILNESLRLYPPVVATIRQSKNDIELGGTYIPKGTELIIPILAVHHDPSLWHHDANEFNPSRFASGEHQVAFMSFGLGARRCVGQNLAILLVKLVVAMILQRFTFELAPSYVHAPTVVMLLHPQYGAPLIFRKLYDK